jgi:hydrogenase nickel incorporation protein HypA/HybF
MHIPSRWNDQGCVNMHELSIAHSIIEIVVKEMSKNRLTRVDTVTLRVGEMTQILPESLLFGFECLTQETPIAGANLVIESIPARGYCKSCDNEFDFKGWLFSCSLCGEARIDIISGKELDIVSIDGE